MRAAVASWLSRGRSATALRPTASGRGLLARLAGVLRARVLKPVQARGCLALAAFHRRRLRGVVFIGITGSAGKTTTKELVGAVLASRYPGRRSPRTRNDALSLARLILATRRSDRFCVQEVAVGQGRTLDLPLRLLRPQIGVVTNVGPDHRAAFRTLEGTAAEKGKLVAALPPDGTAVLNADDPHVRAMAARCAGRVVTYGLGPDAMVRAEDIRSAWPDRLSFTVLYDDQALPVRTRLCGTHWTRDVLAALAVGVVMGMPLAEGIRAVEWVEPFPGRMSPVTDHEDVTFIRDDWKASLWTIAPALEFMRDGRARRKIVVIGTISDYQGAAAQPYVRVARQALEVADHVFFVGPWASRCLRAKRHPGDESLRAFGTVRAASDHLRGFLRPGDLVLLKGSTVADHLARIVLARTTRVECWRTHCHRRTLCDWCALLTVPAAADAAVREDVPSEVEAAGAGEAREARVVVGLGSPDQATRDTPSGVGLHVVDVLARRLGQAWERDGDALVASAVWNGQVVYLVKPLAAASVVGSALARVTRRLGVTASQCLVVYDDVDLPLGTVRVRARGGAGRHEGMRSVIHAFQSEAIPRVKVGVGRPPDGAVAEHAGPPRPPEAPASLEQACARATDALLGLIARTRVTMEAPTS